MQIFPNKVCIPASAVVDFSAPMKSFDADDPSENEWEEQGNLAWNEYDWERYLRARNEDIERYLECYEKAAGYPDRIDEAARLMGWDTEGWEEDELSEVDDTDPLTIHRNPVFISTKAIYLGIQRHWQRLAHDAESAPRHLAVDFLTSLHRGEDQAMQAIHALDQGDFTLAVSLFKRALRELNATLGMTDERSMLYPARLAEFRQNARPRLFDLREIWLRVISECRDEAARPMDGEA